MIRAAVKRDCHRVRSVVCVKRISTFILVLGLLGSLLLVYFGMIGYVPEIFCGVGLAMFGLTTPAILYIWCKRKDRMGCLFKQIIRGCRWLRAWLRKLRRVKTRSPRLICKEKPLPVAVHPKNRPPATMKQKAEAVMEVEKIDDSQTGDTAVKNTSQTALVTWLAQNRLGASSVLLPENLRHGQYLPAESWTPRNVQQVLDEYMTLYMRSVTSIFESIRDEYFGDDLTMRPVQNTITLAPQTPPQQGLYSQSGSFQMPRVPEMPCREKSAKVQDTVIHFPPTDEELLQISLRQRKITQV